MQIDSKVLFGLTFYLIFTTVFIIKGSHCVLALCHSFFPDEEGVILSPEHSISTHIACVYDISRVNHQDFCGVRLTFENFSTEEPDTDGFCKKDWLAIDQCVPEGGSRFCGNIETNSVYEYPFQPEAEAFRLIFCSANYSTEKHFRLSYKLIKECNNGLFWDPPISFIPGIEPKDTPCFTQVTEQKGIINSPFFPKNYSSDLDCIYEFIRESPYTCGVRMKSIQFDLDQAIETEMGGACLDFFHTPGCGFLCGKLQFVWTAKFQPGATSLKFHFHSDENETRSGFQIAFEQVYVC